MNLIPDTRSAFWHPAGGREEDTRFELGSVPGTGCDADMFMMMRIGGSIVYFTCVTRPWVSSFPRRPFPLFPCQI